MKKNPTKQIHSYFMFGGVLLIVFGLIHLYSFFQSHEVIKLYDGIFNASFGILFLINSKLLSLKKIAVIYLTNFTIGFGLIYSALMNRGLNLVILGYGGFLLYWLFQLKKKNILK